MSSTILTIPRFKTLINSLKFLRDPLTAMRGNMAEYGHTYRFYIGGIIAAGTTSEKTYSSDTHFAPAGSFVKDHLSAKNQLASSLAS